MALPAILPLMGLLGGAAAFAGQGPLNSFLTNRAGRQFAESGVDFSSFGEAGEQLQSAMMAGSFAPQVFGGQGQALQNMFGQAFGQQQADASLENALQRAQIAVAPQYARLREDRRRYEADKANSARFHETLVNEFNMPASYIGTPLAADFARNVGLNAETLVNAGKTEEQILSDQFAAELEREAANIGNIASIAEANRSMRGPNVPPVLGEEAAVRGDQWLAMTPDQRGDVIQSENRVSTVTDVLDYVTETTAAGRKASPQKTAELQTAYSLSVLPYMQSRFQAGAMQKEELKLFEELGGDPFAWNQMTLAEQGKVTRILQEMRTDLDTQYRSFGLADTAPGGVPAGLVPGRPGGAAAGDPSSAGPIPRVD